MLETWRRAASAESASIEAPRGVFLGRGVPLPSRLWSLGGRGASWAPAAGSGRSPDRQRIL